MTVRLTDIGTNAKAVPASDARSAAGRSCPAGRDHRVGPRAYRPWALARPIRLAAAWLGYVHRH